MNFKKNVKKAGVGLLVSAVAIGGAFAWLTNSDIATKHNDIKVGSLKIIFDNQADVITLTANEAIPMTAEYAYEALTPYSFTINNTGAVKADYTLKAVAEDGNTISNDLILISIDSKEQATWYMVGGFFDTQEAAEAQLEAQKTSHGASDDQIKVMLVSDWNAGMPEAMQNKYVILIYGNIVAHPEHGYFNSQEEASNKKAELVAQYPGVPFGGAIPVETEEGTKYVVTTEEVGGQMTGTWKKLSDIVLSENVGINVGGVHHYTMYARIDKDAVNNDILGKTASFHLELEAVQNNEAVDTHE